MLWVMLIMLISLMFSILQTGDILQEVNTIYVGDSLRVDAAGISKATTSNRRAIRISKENGTLLIDAKARGNATMHIWRKGAREAEKYSFIVMSAAVHKKVAAVRDALKGVSGIKVRSAGENVYLTGTVTAREDLELIKRVTASQKDVMNYVRLSGPMQQEENSKLSSVLLDMGLYGIEIRKTDSITFLSANARTKKQAENAELYLRSNVPSGKFDIKVVPYQIDIDVKIVEMSSTMGRQMGLELPGELSLTRHTVLSRIEIDSVLHLSESHGRAKLLSNPSLSANDGENASFHAGGAIPIRLSSRYSSSLEWKNYGVILNFTPKVISEDTVELSISSQFSSLDADNSSEKDIPGFVVREVRTVVTMDSGKSVVISGLVNRNSSRANRGLPGISDIPVLSDLFSSNEVSSEDTELAVIVTASIRFRSEELFIDKKLDDLLAEMLGDEA